MYYNGLSHTEATKTVTNGIHSKHGPRSRHWHVAAPPLTTGPCPDWCERGGIVGRGILVDWLRWYEHKHGNPPSPVTRHEIPASELEETIKYQGLTPRPGDIMIIRSGYVRWHKYVYDAVFFFLFFSLFFYLFFLLLPFHFASGPFAIRLPGLRAGNGDGKRKTTAQKDD